MNLAALSNGRGAAIVPPVCNPKIAKFGAVAVAAELATACHSSPVNCDQAGVARTGGPWRLTMRVPDSLRRGQPVSLALVLENAGDSAVDPHLGSPAAADFVVTRAGDTSEVWSKLHGAQLLSLLLRKGVIAPGDSLRVEHRWDQRDNSGHQIPAGTYCLWGNMKTSGPGSLRSGVATLHVAP